MHAFSSDRLSRISQLERWHFWFIGRQALITRLLSRHLSDRSQPVLDLGCGTGFVVGTLSRGGYRVIGLDRLADGFLAMRPWHPTAPLIQADGACLPFRAHAFGAVMLLDVLEHVDDQAVLAEVHRVLCPGGVALITVPAVPWLWGHRDRVAGHRRRYTCQRLLSALAEAHLQVREVRYYQCLLFPLVIMTRLLGRRGPGLQHLEERPAAVNAALAWVNRLEVRLGDWIAWPWGSSLVAVCRKQ